MFSGIAQWKLPLGGRLTCQGIHFSRFLVNADTWADSSVMATAFALTSDTMDGCAGELIIASPGCWAALTVTGLPFVEDKNRFALSASHLSTWLSVLRWFHH